jgi:hypothetical protein
MGQIKDLVIKFEEQFGREPNAVEMFLFSELEQERKKSSKSFKNNKEKDFYKQRQQLHDIVNKYAIRNSIPFSYAWKDLYMECKWQTHVDFIKRAENKKVPTLDYIVGSGYLPIVLEVARKEMQDES